MHDRGTAYNLLLEEICEAKSWAVVTVVTVVFIYDATQDYKVRWGNQNLILGIY